MNPLNILYLFWHHTGGFPRLNELRQIQRNYREGQDQRLINDLKRFVPRGSRPTRMQPGVIQHIAPELGANWVYLGVLELAPIIITAAQEGWEPGKTQARVEQTNWWKRTTQQQREWLLLSPAEKERAVAMWSVEIVNNLRNLYGVKHVEQQGWSATAKYTRKFANAIASGRTDISLFTLRHQIRAEKIKGTPAWNRLQREIAAAGAIQAERENLSAELSEFWRTWLGTSVPPPKNVDRWAAQIQQNVKTQADWEEFVRDQALSRWPKKPEFVPFEQWVSPAKGLLSNVLEIGDVDDDDPLLLSYTKGEIPDLAALNDRARLDVRFGRTTRNRRENRAIGMGLLQRWGFA